MQIPGGDALVQERFANPRKQNKAQFTRLVLLVPPQVGKQISESQGTQGGGGMATAGIVLGWVGIGTLTFFIIAGILSSATR